jgi:hypothetical protein
MSSSYDESFEKIQIRFFVETILDQILLILQLNFTYLVAEHWIIRVISFEN